VRSALQRGWPIPLAIKSSVGAFTSATIVADGGQPVVLRG
jgi:hypothetical protein